VAAAATGRARAASRRCRPPRLKGPRAAPRRSGSRRRRRRRPRRSGSRRRRRRRPRRCGSRRRRRRQVPTCRPRWRLRSARRLERPRRPQRAGMRAAQGWPRAARRRPARLARRAVPPAMRSAEVTPFCMASLRGHTCDARDQHGVAGRSSQLEQPGIYVRIPSTFDVSLP